MLYFCCVLSSDGESCFFASSLSLVLTPPLLLSFLILWHSEPKILVSGSDFYAFPRMDSKGERIAWIEWHHPNMPWDKAELWVGYISDNG